MIDKETFQVGIYILALTLCHLKISVCRHLRVLKVHRSFVQFNWKTILFDLIYFPRSIKCLGKPFHHSTHISAHDECLPKHVSNFPIRILVVVRSTWTLHCTQIQISRINQWNYLRESLERRIILHLNQSNQPNRIDFICLSNVVESILNSKTYAEPRD